MYVVCLDLEGVLVPEIWVEFAETAGIPELKRTTRDEPDYDKLMRYRLDILKQHGLGLEEIQETIAKLDPLPVRAAADKKTRHADDLLQHAGGCAEWRNHRLQDARRKYQADNRQSAADDGL